MWSRLQPYAAEAATPCYRCSHRMWPGAVTVRGRAWQPVEVADLTYALAMLGEQQPAATPPLLSALSGRARAKTDLASFSSRQVNPLT